jgi:hypothetical protein
MAQRGSAAPSWSSVTKEQEHVKRGGWQQPPKLKEMKSDRIPGDSQRAGKAMQKWTNNLTAQDSASCSVNHLVRGRSRQAHSLRLS